MAALTMAMAALGGSPVAAQGEGPDEFEVLRLFLDESVIETIPGLKRLSVTNPRIADVVIVGPDEVRVDGRAVGRTSLYVWDKDGRRRVELVVLDRRDDLAQLITEAVNLPEIVVEVINNQAILKGWIASEAERRLATELARVYIPTVVDLLQVRGQRSFSPEDEIRSLLNLPEVKVTVIMDPRAQATQGQGQGAPGGQAALPPIAAVILEGFVSDQRDSARAQAIAQTFSTNVQNFIEVVSPIQVQVQAHILELAKTAATTFGFNWGTVQVTGTAGGPIAVAQPPGQQIRFLENVFNGAHGQGTFFGAQTDVENNYPWEFENINRLDPLFLVVSWLIQNSKGRVLANPKVVTRSGTPANINVGGEFPYPQNAGLGAVSTAFKQFGIQLGIEPNVDHKGNINTTLDINVSTPDFGRAQVIGGIAIPPLTTRTTKSSVTVKDREHIVVSGLLSEIDSKNFENVPYLHRLPLIGNLFKTKRYQDDKQEVVVIITPQILASSEQQRQIAQVQAAAAAEDAARQHEAEVAAAGGKAAAPAGSNRYPDETGRIPVPQKPHQPWDTSIWALQGRERDDPAAVETIPAALPRGPSGKASARERIQTILHGLRTNIDYHDKVKAAHAEMAPGKPQYDSPVPWGKEQIDWDNYGTRVTRAALPTHSGGDLAVAALAPAATPAPPAPPPAVDGRVAPATLAVKLARKPGQPVLKATPGPTRQPAAALPGLGIPDPILGSFQVDPTADAYLRELTGGTARIRDELHLDDGDDEIPGT